MKVITRHGCPSQKIHRILRDNRPSKVPSEECFHLLAVSFSLLPFRSNPLIDSLNKCGPVVTRSKDESCGSVLSQQLVSMMRPRRSDSEAMLKARNRRTPTSRKTILERSDEEVHRSKPVRYGLGWH